MATKDIKEVAKEIKGILNSKYPSYTFSLTSERGMTDSLYISWLSADFYPFNKPDVKEISVNVYYVTEENRLNNKGFEVMKTIYDVAVKYQKTWERGDNHTSKNFYLDINVGRWDKPFEVTKNTAPQMKNSSTNTGGNRTSSWEWGTQIMAKNGWTLYKKTLPDGRTVRNAVKDKSTPVNKEQWNDIRGEVYVNAGFKWSPKTQSFQYWGDIFGKPVDEVVEDLFNVLGKYYSTKNDTAKIEAIKKTDLTGCSNEWVFDLIMYYYQTDFTEMGLFTTFKEKISQKYILTHDQIMYLHEKWIDQENAKNDKEEEKRLLKNMPQVVAQTEEPEPRFKLNDSYLSLPNNPKLDFIKITQAEGLIAYTDLFPMTFGSFKQITKFIADNCELKEGYDKHWVQLKFTFDKDVYSDKWYIGQADADPKRWPNLWAKEYLQVMIYHTLYGSIEYSVTQDSIFESLGSDGMELTTKEFYDIINTFCGMEYYDLKKFPNFKTVPERLGKLKETFPKLFSIFDNQQPEPVTKEIIEKKIKVLSILAKNGDELAAKKIKVLKIMLNN